MATKFRKYELWEKERPLDAQADWLFKGYAKSRKDAQNWVDEGWDRKFVPVPKR